MEIVFLIFVTLLLLGWRPWKNKPFWETSEWKKGHRNLKCLNCNSTQHPIFLIKGQSKDFYLASLSEKEEVSICERCYKEFQNNKHSSLIEEGKKDTDIYLIEDVKKNITILNQKLKLTTSKQQKKNLIKQTLLKSKRKKNQQIFQRQRRNLNRWNPS